MHDNEVNPHKLKILNDYLYLSILPELSEIEERRLSEIYELSEQDNEIYLMATIIDGWIFENYEHLTEEDKQEIKNQEVRIRELLYTLENSQEPAQSAREIVDLQSSNDPQPGGSYCGQDFHGRDFHGKDLSRVDMTRSEERRVGKEC